MARIAIELVVKTYDQLEKELNFVKKKLPIIKTINIPDLIRFDIRSWEASKFSLKYFKESIPHIRAIDFNDEKTKELAKFIIENQIEEVLIIKGDKPQGINCTIYSNSSIKMTRKLKKLVPNLKIYGGIDPYRSSIKEELDYTKEKKEAGMCGFFTQPFFDLRYIEIYAEALEGENIFWGVSPVLKESSKSYWETRNHVVFPKQFNLSMEWNINFAKDVVKFCKEKDFNMYFMPININFEKYFTKIF